MDEDGSIRFLRKASEVLDQMPGPSEPTPTVVAEPVEWQVQFQNGIWSNVTYDKHQSEIFLRNKKGIVAIRPLYASPQPATVGRAMVGREEAIRAVCPHVKQWADDADIQQGPCKGCPPHIDTEYGRGKQMCRINAEGAADAILALLASPVTTSPTFRDGIEAAAKWHDQRAVDIENLLDQELYDETRQHVSLARGRHLQHAISIRALAPPVAAGSERDDGDER